MKNTTKVKRIVGGRVKVRTPILSVTIAVGRDTSERIVLVIALTHSTNPNLRTMRKMQWMNLVGVSQSLLLKGSQL